MEVDELLSLRFLREAFPSLSLEAIASAYTEANGRPDMAADILEQKERENDGAEEDEYPAVLSFTEIKPVARAPSNRKRSVKVSTGTVSNARKWGPSKRASPGIPNKNKPAMECLNAAPKQHKQDFAAKQQQNEVEDFLFSMLGNETNIGVDVVRDVIDQCEGDVQKSLDALLLISSSKREAGPAEGLLSLVEIFPGKDITDIIQAYEDYGGDLHGITSKLLLSSPDKNSTQKLFSHVLSEKPALASVKEKSYLLQEEDHVGSSSKCGDKTKEKLSRDLLNCLYKSEEKDVEPKAAACSAGPSRKKKPLDLSEWKVATAEPKNRQKKKASDSYGDWDEYERHKRSASEHWATMKHYFEEATAAYAIGERVRAAVLSEKGQEFKALSREATQRASERIFYIKNKEQENNITIDLHGQVVDEAMRLLKIHLHTLTPIKSVNTLTVITGHGVHADNRKANLKAAVRDYLERKGISWNEINPGRLQINLH